MDKPKLTNEELIMLTLLHIIKKDTSPGSSQLQSELMWRLAGRELEPL